MEIAGKGNLHFFCPYSITKQFFNAFTPEFLSGAILEKRKINTLKTAVHIYSNCEFLKNVVSLYSDEVCSSRCL